MSEFKYLPYTHIHHKYYNPVIWKKWFRILHHWFCIIGNYHEPLGYPGHNAEAGNKSKFGPILYWLTRNLFHNFSHFWIGITPIGKRYEWITPQENGWEQVGDLWVKPRRISLPIYHGVFGWQDRGSFRMHPVLWMMLMCILVWLFS